MYSDYPEVGWCWLCFKAHNAAHASCARKNRKVFVSDERCAALPGALNRLMMSYEPFSKRALDDEDDVCVCMCVCVCVCVCVSEGEGG